MQEQIFTIIDKFKKEPDLKNELLAYFSIYLVKLDCIGDKLEHVNIDIAYKVEFEHLLNKEIIKVLDTYTRLPLDMRNSLINETNKTGKQLLAEQLEVLAARIEALWQNILSDEKLKLLAMHKKLKDNFATDMELEKAPDNAFHLDSEELAKRAKKLIQNSEGSWETGFKKSADKIQEQKQNRGITPSVLLAVITILVVIIITVSYLFK